MGVLVNFYHSDTRICCVFVIQMAFFHFCINSERLTHSIQQAFFHTLVAVFDGEGLLWGDRKSTVDQYLGEESMMFTGESQDPRVHH